MKAKHQICRLHKLQNTSRGLPTQTKFHNTRSQLRSSLTDDLDDDPGPCLCLCPYLYPDPFPSQDSYFSYVPDPITIVNVSTVNSHALVSI